MTSSLAIQSATGQLLRAAIFVQPPFLTYLVLVMHHDVSKSTGQGLHPIEVELTASCQGVVPRRRWILLSPVWPLRRRAMLT